MPRTIDVEGDIDLRLAALSALDAVDGELAELVTRVGRCALALVHDDINLGLPD